MRVQDILLAMRRRWYLSVATLVLAVVATLLTVALVGPTYQAKGAVLIVPPGATLEQRPGNTNAVGNPYLQLGGLDQARDIVIRSMSSKSTYVDLCGADGDALYESMKRGLCTANPSVSFEITQDYESSAPVILVTAEAGTAQDSVTTLATVMARVPTTLEDLQGSLNLRQNAEITSTPIVTDTLPDIVRKDQIRASVLVGGGVLALGILATGLLDGALTTRRRAAVGEESADEEVRAPVADQDADLVDGWAASGASGNAVQPVPVERRSGRFGRRHTRATPTTSTPGWVSSDEEDLESVGADRSVPRWD